MKNFFVSFAFLALLSLTGTARADHSCKADFDKFCAGKVVCGKGACHACLNDHMAELDKACQGSMQKWDEKEEAKLSMAAEKSGGAHGAMGGHACKGDFDKFCAGKVVCGKGACHACLNEHLSQLDKACAHAVEKWDEKEEARLSEAALHKKG